MAVERLHLLAAASRILHFAPEGAVSPWLSRRGEYFSADLRPGYDLLLNLERIDQPENAWDVVVANHVLEHVDDRATLGELFRVLRPGGRLIASVPLVEGWDCTYEDPMLTTRVDRQDHFGQEDHVRYYGRDFRDRVRAAGFQVSEYVASGADTVRYALIPGERIFIGQKPLA